GRRGLSAPHSVQDSDRRSNDRGVFAHLRAELHPPQAALPPGAGGLPAPPPGAGGLPPPPALSAVGPAAALLPPERLARSGDGAVPLPSDAADDHARTARCP